MTMTVSPHDGRAGQDSGLDRILIVSADPTVCAQLRSTWRPITRWSRPAHRST